MQGFKQESFLADENAADKSPKNFSNSCQVVSFFSPKGKSGRTTLIVNLALALVRITGEPVGIIDADTHFADMDAFLNIEPQSTIVEALRDLSYLKPGTLLDYFEEAVPNVYVLCGAKTPQQAAYVEPEGLTQLIKMARSSFRYVLVDMAPGFNPISIAVAEASQNVFLTAMADNAFEVQHLRRAMEIFESLDNYQQRVGCIISRLQPDMHHARELENQIGCPVMLLPNEYMLCAEAANNGRMALDVGPGSPLTAQIERLAQKLCPEGR